MRLRNPRYLEQMTEGGDPGGTGSGEHTPDPAAIAATEKEARLFGWRPAEEFDGPEEKWKPAEEFLEEGKRINGFLRKDLDKLRAELTKRDATLAEMQQTITEFAEFHRDTEKKAYERAKKELMDARKEALRENDGERVVEIEERLELLGDAPVVPQPRQPQQTNQPDPVWEGWVSENKWFAESPKLRAITNGYGDIVRAENPRLVGLAFLNEVKRRVQEDFPEHFENGERRRASSVSGAGETRNPGRKKSFADLPAEAQKACDKFVKQKLVASREAYVADYFAGE